MPGFERDDSQRRHGKAGAGKIRRDVRGQTQRRQNRLRAARNQGGVAGVAKGRARVEPMHVDSLEEPFDNFEHAGGRLGERAARLGRAKGGQGKCDRAGASEHAHAQSRLKTAPRGNRKRHAHGYVSRVKKRGENRYQIKSEHALSMPARPGKNLPNSAYMGRPKSPRTSPTRYKEPAASTTPSAPHSAWARESAL